jgi:hypothetical protein
VTDNLITILDDGGETLEMSASEIAGFWSNVRVGGRMECWPWTAGTFDDGYGCYSVDGRSYRCNRLALLLFRGSLGVDIQACHVCDNPICCNGFHLFPGTNEQNRQDSVDKRRTPIGERNGRTQLTDADVLEIRRLADGQILRQSVIAKKYGITLGTACDIIHGRTWRHLPVLYVERPDLICGTAKGSAKLTEAQVSEIRRRFTNGEGLRPLGREYGVTKGTISGIIKRLTWRHVA